MFPTNREIWKRIDCCKNYEVSWFGRVRNAKTGRILKGGISGDGYPNVGLCKNGKAKTHKIHQLVAREWIDNPAGKACVDHIDGIRTNNHHENLRWATHSENSMNQKKTNKPTSSIYKGVSFHKPLQKWLVHIKTPDKVLHLGYFINEREAAEVYNAAALLHYKEFAQLNIFND